MSVSGFLNDFFCFFITRDRRGLTYSQSEMGNCVLQEVQYPEQENNEILLKILINDIIYYNLSSATVFMFTFLQ